jgi:RNA polymerase sigma factor (sigma-70 family)
MLVNSYAGIVDQNVSRLVVSRARRLRVSSDEIHDLQQEIVPKLAAFQFDAARSNGASRNTVLTSVVDRQICAYLRAKGRYENHIEHLQQMRRPATARHNWPDHVSQPEPVDLRMDLAAAMQRLSERDRAICDGLSHGLTVKDIAAKLGCCRDTVSRAILRIRRVFADAGLEAWIDPNFDERDHA